MGSSLVDVLEQSLTRFAKAGTSGSANVIEVLQAMLELVETFQAGVGSVDLSECNDESCNFTLENIPTCMPGTDANKSTLELLDASIDEDNMPKPCATVIAPVDYIMPPDADFKTGLDLLRLALVMARKTCTPKGEKPEVLEQLAKLQIQFESLDSDAQQRVVDTLGSEPIMCRLAGGVTPVLPNIAAAISDETQPLKMHFLQPEFPEKSSGYLMYTLKGTVATDSVDQILTLNAANTSAVKLVDVENVDLDSDNTVSVTIKVLPSSVDIVKGALLDLVVTATRTNGSAISSAPGDSNFQIHLSPPTNTD